MTNLNTLHALSLFLQLLDGTRYSSGLKTQLVWCMLLDLIIQQTFGTECFLNLSAIDGQAKLMDRVTVK